MSSKKKPVSKAAVRDAAQDEVVKTKIGAVTVETALRSVGTAQATIGRTLASVGEQLQQELQQLDDVKRAVAIAKAELEALHGKDEILRSIEELSLSLEAQRETAEREAKLAKIQKDDDEDAERRQADADAAEFALTVASDRARSLAMIEAEVHGAKLAERDRREAFERDIATREAAMKKVETDFASFKAQVEAFPAQLKAETEKAASIAGNSVKRDFTQEIALLKKDAEAAKQLADMRINSLENQVTSLTAQVTDAYQKVDLANAKVAEIATRALDSASGQGALAAVQNFANNKDSNNGASRKA